MKRFLSVLMIISIILFAFAGCAGKDSKDSSSSDKDTATKVYTLFINTEGMGQIAYATNGDKPEFNDEFPVQSTQVSADENSSYVIEAKADDGYKFVKWTKNGDDYSTDSIIEVTVTEDMNLVAVFEAEE